MSNVVHLFLSEELAMLLEPLRAGDIKHFNEVLEGTEALTASDQRLLTDMLIEHALTYANKAIPGTIDVERLMMLGVTLIGETYDNDTVPLAESLAIAELFEAVSNIHIEQLLSYQKWPAFSEETYSSARGIDHQLHALFYGPSVSHGETTLQLGAAGSIYLDWVMGLSSFDTELGELRDIQVTIKPHAVMPHTNDTPEDHLVFRLNGRVINGSLKDITVAEGCSRTAVEARRPCNCVKRE